MDDRSATDRRGSTWRSCPFVDRNDIRCANRFSLGRIDQAFAVCFGSYRACPMYHRMTAEAVAADRVGTRGERQHEPDRDHAPLITITADGSAVPLRATGT